MQKRSRHHDSIVHGRDGFWSVQISTVGPEEGEDDAENGRDNGSIPGRLGFEGNIEQKLESTTTFSLLIQVSIILTIIVAYQPGTARF